MKIRRMEREDINRGLLEVLANLSEVKELLSDQYLKIWSRQLVGDYRVLVVEHEERIIATGTLLIIWGFLRGGSKAGRITAVATHSD